MCDDSRLPVLFGGWTRQTIDAGWVQIPLAVPADPDSLLADETVLAANREDDYMPYWASLWPAAKEMAAALSWSAWPQGTRVLELGCGLGLVGIAGLLRGWDVQMTDYEPKALVAAAWNAELNGFPDAKTAVLDWRLPSEERFSAIIACDVLYETHAHRPLLKLLDAMLSDDGCAWIGDPGRTPTVEFHHTATQAGYRIVVRGDDGVEQLRPARGQFQVLELTRLDDAR